MSQKTTPLPLDPSNLQTWSDAFTHHPLPTVHSIHTHLLQQIASHRSQLRSLVGSSYRELLGTAERIIEMEAQCRSVEGLMGGLGRGCSSGVVKKLGGNYGGMRRREFEEEGEDGGSLKRRRRVRVRIVGRAVEVVGRVVRGKGDVLLGGMVFVLGRLVLKGVVDDEDEEEEEEDEVVLLGELRRKLGGVRKRLVGYIERCLVNGDKEDTVKALCAYSLISSSAPRDVLRFFLQMRFRQLEAVAETTTTTTSEGSLGEMLDLYSRTLLDTKELFPRRFADALAQLSKSALIRDESVQAVRELSLDIYEQWISDDVRNFHPWVRHDQLSSAEVGAALASWTKQAQACLLQALKDSLAAQSDVHTVLTMRKQVITKYLSLSAKLRNEEHARAVEDIRTVFLGKLQELADKAARMSDLAIIDTQQQSDDSLVPSKIWDLATENSDLKGGGAVYLRKAIMERQTGHSTPSQTKITNILDDWTRNLKDFAEAITSMRQSKWDDDDDLDLLEIDDFMDGEMLETTLRQRDPKDLEEKLYLATAISLKRAYGQVEGLGEGVSNPGLVIRILRDVDGRKRGLGDVLDKTGDELGASERFITSLHKTIAGKVCEAPLGKFKISRMRALVELWDGNHLPIQPSPMVFRFVKEVQRGMADVGDDLWSPDAVGVLKGVVEEELGERFEGFIVREEVKGGGEVRDGDAAAAAAAAKVEEEGEEGESSSPLATETIPSGEEEEEEERRNLFLQMLFDVVYLQRIFSTSGGSTSSSSSPSSSDGKFEKVAVELRRRVGLEEVAIEKLRRSAGEYWRRTFLLFGLLAGATG